VSGRLRARRWTWPGQRHQARARGRATSAYYLIDAGRVVLEREAGVRTGFRRRLAPAARRVPLLLYLGAIVDCRRYWSVWLLMLEALASAWPRWALLPLVVVLIPVASQLARGPDELAGDAAGDAAALAPDGLSRRHPGGVKHPGGGADHAQQSVGVDSLLEALEVRFLANRDERHVSACLAIFSTRRRRLPTDGALVDLARHGIEALNSDLCRQGRRHLSSSSIARGAGTRRSASGWGPSASAASWPT
jgi:cyclic beta-1,2-glucan synthetase